MLLSSLYNDTTLWHCWLPRPQRQAQSKSVHPAWPSRNFQSFSLSRSLRRTSCHFSNKYRRSSTRRTQSGPSSLSSQAQQLALGHAASMTNQLQPSWQRSRDVGYNDLMYMSWQESKFMRANEDDMTRGKVTAVFPVICGTEERCYKTKHRNGGK